MSEKKSELSRRGFLGVIGAVGAATATPLSWSREAEAEAVDLSEYTESGSLEYEAEQSLNGETWEPTKLGGGFSSFVRGDTPQITIGNEKFDLYDYNISFSHDVLEITDLYAEGFDGASTYAPGLKEAEITCTFHGEQGRVEAYFHKMGEAVPVVITTNDVKFEFKAIPTSVEHEFSPYDRNAYLSTITFKSTGDITRCLK